MLRVIALTAFTLLPCVPTAFPQNPEITAPTQPTKKDANPQGIATQGATGTPDQNPPANKSGGGEAQTPAVGPSVKCAIRLPDANGQSASTTNLLDLAKNCHNTAEDNSAKNPTAGLDDRLFLSVSPGQSATTDKTPPKIEDWRLSINGVQIDDAQLAWEAEDDKTVVLSAKLKRTDSSKASWNDLLTQKLREHTVPVTVVDPSKKPLPSEAFFNLRVIQMKWYSWILLVLLAVLLFILGTHHRLLQMLRDSGPHKGDKAAYSLSRVQVFFWFSITIVCYVVIWIITGDRDTISNDVLTLMGISAGTFLGAVSIDSSKKSQAQSQLPDAAAKVQQAQAAVAAAPAGAAADAAKQALAVRQQNFDQLNDRTFADYSENFLTDILSDENGPSFHRFQILAWTLVLGFIFIASVTQTLGMPTFGNTLLGLMGISGGTYLGFKFPEQKTP